MVHSLQCCSAHTPLRSLLFSILLLLLTSSMEVAHSDARRVPLRLLVEIGASKGQEGAEIVRGEMTMEGRRALIGSRPPRCERVCMSCGHCEAVQVPVVPQDHHHLLQKKANAAISATALFTYRVDGITNYKPLSWKCRCGDTIVDP